MIKHLTAHGNSMALVIEKAILELLHITPETPLKIQTDGESLIISPVKDKARERKFQAALAKINKRYAKTLKALAA